MSASALSYAACGLVGLLSYAASKLCGAGRYGVPLCGGSDRYRIPLCDGANRYLCFASDRYRVALCFGADQYMCFGLDWYRVALCFGADQYLCFGSDRYRVALCCGADRYPQRSCAHGVKPDSLCETLIDLRCRLWVLLGGDCCGRSGWGDVTARRSLEGAPRLWGSRCGRTVHRGSWRCFGSRENWCGIFV